MDELYENRIARDLVSGIKKEAGASVTNNYKTVNQKVMPKKEPKKNFWKDKVIAKNIIKENKRISYDVSKVMDEPKAKYKSIFYKESKYD
jgi:hypothetical protein